MVIFVFGLAICCLKRTIHTKYLIQCLVYSMRQMLAAYGDDDDDDEGDDDDDEVNDDNP